MAMERWLQEYADDLASRGRSSRTIRTYTEGVRVYVGLGYQFTLEGMGEWLGYSLGRHTPNTTATRIYALNDYCRYKGYGCRLKPIAVETPMYMDEVLTEGQYRRLLDGLERDGDWEWYSVVRLLGCTGLRIAEAMQITGKDIAMRKRSIRCKGSRYRQIWFPKGFREKVLPHIGDGPVIRHKDGYVRTKLHRLARKYGIPEKSCHPHAFRALFARMVYAKTKDIRLVSNLLGHRSISTTTKYLRVSGKGMGRKVSRIVDW